MGAGSTKDHQAGYKRSARIEGLSSGTLLKQLSAVEKVLQERQSSENEWATCKNTFFFKKNVFL